MSWYDYAGGTLALRGYAAQAPCIRYADESLCPGCRYSVMDQLSQWLIAQPSTQRRSFARTMFLLRRKTT